MCSGLFLPLLASDSFLLLLRCSFLLVSSAVAWVAYGLQSLGGVPASAWVACGLQSLRGIPALMGVAPFQKRVSSHAPTTSPSTSPTASPPPFLLPVTAAALKLVGLP